MPERFESPLRGLITVFLGMTAIGILHFHRRRDRSILLPVTITVPAAGHYIDRALKTSDSEFIHMGDHI